MAIIFDGLKAASEYKSRLKQEVMLWKKKGGSELKIVAIVFVEDAGGQIYTRKKAEAAGEVGIDYQPYFFSIAEKQQVLAVIAEKNEDKDTVGIIIQKPMRRVYEDFYRNLNENRQEKLRVASFDEWWLELVETLSPRKDVDGLTPKTMQAIKGGTWQFEGYVLPATVSAAKKALVAAGNDLNLFAKNDFSRDLSKGFVMEMKIAIIGKSDLLGRPLAAELKNLNFEVDLLGRKELLALNESGDSLKNYQLIVSATGLPNLIKVSMIADKSILIDIGEPKGDLDFMNLLTKAAWMTPVPGGVGPLTVISLLENCLTLAKYNSKNV